LSILQRVSNWYFGDSKPAINTRSGSVGSAGGTSPLPGVIPPIRSEYSGSLDNALALDAVYRAIDIISTNVMQLELVAKKQGRVTDNSLVRKPNVDDSLSKFLKRTTINLAGHGNAYWLIDRDENGVVINLSVLQSLSVSIFYDENGNKFYQYGDKTYRRDQVKHLRRIEIEGSPYGLGPIQACRARIAGVKEVAYYGDNWFANAGVPTGVLSSTDQLTDDDAARAKATWYESQSTRSVAVIGNGLSYHSVVVSPEEAQFIEAQKFSVQTIARMFGIPAGWLLAELGGNSLTYNNQEQVWIEYVRNTLMSYLKEIEDAFTELTPNGTSVKFDVDGLLRPDSKTRAEIHEKELTHGWKTINEIRIEEGLLPLSQAQLAALKPAPNPKPVSDENV